MALHGGRGWQRRCGTATWQDLQIDFEEQTHTAINKNNVYQIQHSVNQLKNQRKQNLYLIEKIFTSLSWISQGKFARIVRLEWLPIFSIKSKTRKSDSNERAAIETLDFFFAFDFDIVRQFCVISLRRTREVYEIRVGDLVKLKWIYVLNWRERYRVLISPREIEFWLKKCNHS